MGEVNPAQQFQRQVSEGAPPKGANPTVDFINSTEGAKQATACYGQDLTQAQKEMVTKGAGYFEDLAQNPDAVMHCIDGLPKDQVEDRLRCMMWFMDVDALRMHGPADHSEAAMHTFSDHDNVLYKFIEKCGQQMPGQSYNRLSTHYPVSRTERHQKGINMEGLPFDKKTLLIGHRVDGSTFIKMEHHGCAPFWEKGFRTPHHVMDYVGHATGFLRSVGQKLGYIPATKGARKEKASASTVKLFTQLYVSAKKAENNNVKITKSDIKKFEKEASEIVKGGADQLKTHLFVLSNTSGLDPKDRGKALELAKHLSSRLAHDESIGAGHVLRQQNEIIHNFRLDRESRKAA